MNWFRKKRIANLEVKLAGAVAADRARRELVNATGVAHPRVMEDLAREVAEIEQRLKQLKEPSTPMKGQP